MRCDDESQVADFDRQQAELARQRAECWRKFNEVVDAAAAGDFEPGRAYVRHIRTQHGNACAEQAAREMRAWLNRKARNGNAA